MQFFKLLTISTLFMVSTHAIPVVEIIAERGLIDDIHLTDDLLLFDAPAFPDPKRPGETLVDIQTFAFSKVVSFGSVIPGEVKLVIKALAALGVDAAERIQELEKRLKLFLAIGLPGKSEELIVPGCSKEPQTGPTDLVPDLGLSRRTMSLGQCDTTKKATGSINLDLFDTRQIGNTIHFAPNSGFGVISDIDDTLKISNVLDKAQLAKATFLDDPKPVTGMPELFSSLANSFPEPQFIYITGSPFQLYPFLNGFIKSTFSAASGPIWTRNLTLTNPAEIVSLISGGSKTLEYKISQIDRLHTMYPNKKWLAIGDSTEKDPEVYAEIFKKYPGFISCIWIRAAPGAANEPSRFATAFRDIPKEKFNVFNDEDISSLSSISVVNGECRKA